MHWKCHKKGGFLKKINLNCVRAYIDSLDWIKSKEATINHNNNGDKCFQYAVTACIKFWRNWKKVKLKKDKIKIHRDTMTGKDSIKNLKIVLNVLYAEKGNAYLTYVSKPNLKREKQIILLIISNQKV